VIARPVLIIFGRSRQSGEVPEDWKKTNVSPVFKKGKKEDPGNYRHVSLTSIPGEVMEKAKVLNVFFAVLFPSQTSLWESLRLDVASSWKGKGSVKELVLHQMNGQYSIHI